MSKTKVSSKAEKPSKTLSKVKDAAVSKASKTKDVAKKAVAKEDKSKKNKKKEPTPSSSSESESESEDESSSSSESEDEKPAPKKEAKKDNKKAAKKEESSSESSSDEEMKDASSSSESESEDEKPAPKKAEPKKAAKKEESSSESESESSESESEDEKPAKKAAKKEESDSSDSSDSESESDEAPAKAKAEKESSDSDSSDSSDSSESESEESEDTAKASKKRKADDEPEVSAKKTKSEDVPEGASANLFVGNLSWNVDEEWLQREFSEFGECSCRIVTDRDSGRSRGFGYVEFTSAADAAKAMAAKKDTDLDNRTINLDYSTPRQNNGDRNDRSQQRARSYGDQTSPESDTLFVGNLPFSATEDALRDVFSESGSIQGIRLPTDPESGRPKGFGYVQYSSVEEAKAAHSQLQGAELEGRAIRLDFSTPRPANGGGGGFGGGRGGGRGGGFGGGRGRGGPRGGGGGRGRGGFGGGRGGGDFNKGRGSIPEFKGTKVTF